MSAASAAVLEDAAGASRSVRLSSFAADTLSHQHLRRSAPHCSARRTYEHSLTHSPSSSSIHSTTLPAFPPHLVSSSLLSINTLSPSAMRAASHKAQRLLAATSAPASHSTRHLSTATAATRRASRLPSTSSLSSLQSALRSSFSSSAADAPLTPFPTFPPHKLPAAPQPVLDFKEAKYKKHVKLAPNQRLIVLGFGAIGQGVLPLLFRHIDMQAKQLLVAAVDYSAEAEKHARDYGVETQRVKLTRDDHKAWLQKNVRKGDFLINVSVDVSSVALIEHCQVRTTQTTTEHSKACRAVGGSDGRQCGVAVNTTVHELRNLCGTAIIISERKH